MSPAPSYRVMVEGPARTAGARPFDVLAPSADQVDMEDIATALSRMPLYPGEADRFYSLAQHSLEVARRVPRQAYRLPALLSRAAAAYLGDVSRIRSCFPEVAAAEERIQQVIHARFGLPPRLPPEMAEAIGRAELEIQATEYRDLLPPDAVNRFDAIGIHPASHRITPVPQARARHAFRTYLHMIETADLLGD